MGRSNQREVHSDPAKEKVFQVQPMGRYFKSNQREGLSNPAKGEVFKSSIRECKPGP